MKWYWLHLFDSSILYRYEIDWVLRLVWRHRILEALREVKTKSMKKKFSQKLLKITFLNKIHLKMHLKMQNSRKNTPGEPKIASESAGKIKFSQKCARKDKIYFRKCFEDKIHPKNQWEMQNLLQNALEKAKFTPETAWEQREMLNSP